MTRSFLSEWVKLKRLAIIGGSAAAMSAFVMLANFGLFRAAKFGRNRPGGGQVGRVVGLQLASTTGAVRGLIGTTTLLGIVALVVFASNVGGEYRLGTLRFLLVGEPRRVRLLAGKLTALATLIAGCVAFALVVSVLSSLWFSSLFDVSRSKWFTGAGLQAMFSTYINVVIACVAWGLLGAVLALVLRASAAAIGIGIGYLLVGEAILARAIVGPLFDVKAAWFPGEVLRAFAAGGNASSSYVRAALIAAIYVAPHARRLRHPLHPPRRPQLAPTQPQPQRAALGGFWPGNRPPWRSIPGPKRQRETLRRPSLAEFAPRSSDLGDHSLAVAPHVFSPHPDHLRKSGGEQVGVALRVPCAVKRARVERDAVHLADQLQLLIVVIHATDP